jgi:hypothetical protein
MPLPDDKSIFPILSELAACLCNALAEAKLTTSCFCGIIAGDMPIELGEDCETCVAGYVRLNNAYPSTVRFPDQDADATCQSVMAFNVTVGIARCVPSGDGQYPPTSEELAAYARDVFADMAAIRRAIRCCLVDDKFEDIEYVLGQYTQVPAEGGVGGGEWELTIRELF